MARSARTWPVVLALVAAIALEIVPLPPLLDAVRPPWPAMVLIYWAMMWPHKFGIFTGFCVGIALDVLHGSVLGQNAFALCVVAYLTVRFHLQIRIFPLWQLTMTVFALLTIAAFLQFVVEGIAGYGMIGLGRWPQVISGTLIWPLLMALMDRLRMRYETHTSSF